MINSCFSSRACLLTFTALFGLSACGGGSSSSSVPQTSQTPSDPQNSITSTPLPFVAPTVIPKVLNDTGMVWGANHPTGNNGGCIGETVAEQDCQQGRDAQALAGQLGKVGAGRAGFDFTKLDAAGAELPLTATAWACVRDNHTGFIWEVKTTDGGVHDVANVYRWGGGTAQLNGSLGLRYNDWDVLLDAANAGSGLCGFTDWFVPDLEQLRSIVDYSQVKPTLDLAYFPSNLGGEHWSSTPYANRSHLAWGINFDYGIDFNFSRLNAFQVRLVRVVQ